MEAGSNARFAYEEFFFGAIENRHTRKAYRKAVHEFLLWVDALGVEFRAITPKMVRRYLDDLRVDVGQVEERPASIATQKQHLAALRHFFDVCVIRHAIALNPAASVRGKRYKVVEGKTPEITVQNARRLIASINRSSIVDLRDRAIIATLRFTGARVGAVAGLKVSHFYETGGQWHFHFDEKGGKSREIPCRHDLELMIKEYVTAAGIELGQETPLFRSVRGRTRQLTNKAITGDDVCRMMKKRLRAAGINARVTPHSFRVMVGTQLDLQGVDIADIQDLLGHADPRTTRIYLRRQRRVTRNMVERIPD